MGDQRKRQRTESMIKLSNQKKESKLWYEEANSHIKAGNFSKAIYSYNKGIHYAIIAMAEETTKLTFTHAKLTISREQELMQSFVRINISNDDEDEAEDELRHENETKKEADEKLTDTVGEEKTEHDKKNEEMATPVKEVREDIAKKVKRRRRRGRKPEELYCDKDRAAAVNMGHKDIKQSLKIKRKEDRSKTLRIPEEAEPGTFIALGNYELCRGDLHIALDFMTKALELDPAEKNALVARSKCYILLGQPENALKDAEMALSVDKTFLKAIYQKAESLYYLGDFEHSLMYFHRGLHIRPDHEDFKLGVHKAQKAIENAIGSPYIFSRFLSPKPSSSKAEKSKTESSSVSPDLQSKTSSVKSKTGKSLKKSKLLRELGPDKEYLDNLMKNPNLKCKFKEDDSKIVKTIEETVDYLNARQEFWRQQLPAHLK